MKTFYTLSIHNDFASILYIKKKKKIFDVVNEETIEVDELSDYLQGKKAFHVVIHIEEVFDDIITVPSAINSKKLLTGYILKKFKDTLSTKNILLNFNQITKNKEDKTLTYRVDAVNEKEYIEKLDYIPDLKEIKSATIDKFALLNLSQKCYQNVRGYGYFSVHTYANVVTILVIDDKGDLLFERTSQSLAGVDSSKYHNIFEEINQSIAYVKQQFRNIDFSTILISGSLALDDQAAEHLYFATNLSIAAIYPNTFISGLVDEEPQFHIISLGSIFVKKKDMFIPSKIHNVKEYAITTLFVMIFSLFSLFAVSYYAVDKYIQYSDALERYDNIKSRLVRIVKHTDTFSTQKLQRANQYLQTVEAFSQNHPSDVLLTLKPLITMLKPLSYSFSTKDVENPKIAIVFEKKFTSLNALYNFEKRFKNIFIDINNNKEFHYTKTTDYATMKFHVEISKVYEESPADAPGDSLDLEARIL